MKDITSVKRKIFRIVFFTLSLFWIFVFISPLTKTFVPLGKAFIYVFGLVGFWMALPLLLIFSLILFVLGRRPNWLNARLAIGLVVLLIGISSIWSHAGLGGNEDFDLTFYNSIYQSSSSLMFANEMGGGLVGLALSASFLKTGSAAFVYLFSIIIILVGLVLISFSLIKILIKKISIKSPKEKKEVKKEVSKNNPIQEEHKEVAYVSPVKEISERPIFKPSSLQGQSRLEQESLAFKNEVSNQVPPISYPFVHDMNSSEMTEAVWILDEDESQRENIKQQASMPKNNISLFEPTFDHILEENKEEESPLDNTQDKNLEEENIEEPVSIPIFKPLIKEETPAPENNLFVQKEDPNLLNNQESVEEEEDDFSHTIKNLPQAKARPPYTLPPLSLLMDYEDEGKKEEQIAECEERKDKINEILDGFDSGAHVVGYTIGPSVTRFNIAVDPGVQVSSINRYIPNISVGLGGVPTRFEDVVIGETTSGLEIPNDNRRMVTMKQVASNLPPLNETNNLVIPFGESISGKYISSNLADFPHMLVAGSTNSGKSVYTNSIIISLLLRNRPEDLKLILVDPKQVEFMPYANIPHLLCPIVTEPSQAKVAVDKLIEEMERRYTLFRETGVKNIREFNQFIAEENNVEKLPFIILIVDEFADLASSCKDICESVTRVAAKARAAGIHMIICTQRPTVDVITGTIKANIMVRVALAVSAPVDSMSIINQKGAEELAGYGDMLSICPKVQRLGVFRAQGCNVTSKEIANVVSFIKKQQKVQYDPHFLDLSDHSADGSFGGSLSSIPNNEKERQVGDPRYEEIKRYVMTQEYYSISRIVRDFGFGFTRAGKVFRMLQSDGVIGTSETSSNSKGSKVLMHLDTSVSNSGSTDNSEFKPD